MSAATLAATALRLIQKHGRSGVSLVEPTEGTQDPSKPWKADGPAADQTVATFKAVFVDPHEWRGVGGAPQALTPGTSDVVLVAANSMPAGQAPKAGQLLATAASRWSILYVDPVQPGDTPIVYVLHVRN